MPTDRRALVLHVVLLFDDVMLELMLLYGYIKATHLVTDQVHSNIDKIFNHNYYKQIYTYVFLACLFQRKS